MQRLFTSTERTHFESVTAATPYFKPTTSFITYPCSARKGQPSGNDPCDSVNSSSPQSRLTSTFLAQASAADARVRARCRNLFGAVADIQACRRQDAPLPNLASLHFSLPNLSQPSSQGTSPRLVATTHASQKTAAATRLQQAGRHSRALISRHVSVYLFVAPAQVSSTRHRQARLQPSELPRSFFSYGSNEERVRRRRIRLFNLCFFIIFLALSRARSRERSPPAACLGSVPECDVGH